VAFVLNHRDEFGDDEAIILNYSGRGDKDMEAIMRNVYGP
jgi:tryptophan synthase beta subunit